MSAFKRLEKMAHDRGEGANRFRQLALRIVELAASENIQISPFHDPELPYFSKLSEDKVQRILWLLEMMVQVCEQVRSQEGSLRSPKAMTWAFVKQFGGTLSSDFLENVKETDMVDCYDLNHEMLFANLRFFELMSYSLEDFYCRPWMELFVRDREEVHAQLYSLCEELRAGQHEGIVPTDFIGTYRCYETNSPGLHRFLAGPRFFSPLNKDRVRVGYLCVNSIMRI